MKNEIANNNENINIYKLIRLARGLTVSELSNESGISHNYISQIEKGKRNPSEETKKKLSKSLKVSDKLFDTFQFPDKGPNFFERTLLNILVLLVTK